MLGADKVIATRMEVEDGKYTGDIDFYAYAENKAKAIRDLAEQRGYDLTRCYAYSDSVTDVHMLEAVGHPHAVNPDKDLRRVARDRGWPILVFDQAGRPAQPGAAARRPGHPRRARGRRRRGRRRAASGPTPDGVGSAPEPPRRPAGKSSLVLPPDAAYKGATQLQDQHVSRVPTRRSTLPTGRWSSGYTRGSS